MCYATGTHECSQLVRGSYGRELVVNSVTGTPQESDLLYSADQLDVRAVLDTGIVPPVTFANDSFTFSRNTADEAYSLSVRAQIDSSVFTEVQGASAGVALWAPYFGRMARSSVSRATPINVAITGATAPTRAYIASTGLRSFSYAGAVANTQSFAFDWNAATSLYGTQALLAASDGDVLWYNGFTTTVPSEDPIDDYFALTSVFHQMVTMTNGGTLTFGGAATVTPQDRCVTLNLPRETELARVQASSPFSTTMTTSASSWNVTAVPFAAYGPTAGIPIVIQANATLEDQSIKVLYANPYPEDQLALMNAIFRRTATLTGATTGTVLTYGTTQSYQVPTASSSACASLGMTANIAMPSPLTLGGSLLDTDNQTIAIDRSGPDIPLEFAPTSGNADDWMTILSEVTVVGTATTATQIRLYSTLAPSVMIDPTLLVVGHSYLFETYARLGYPNAATRDYKAIAYPFGTGVVYSSIFTVGS
jgi:hypothetical protein